MSIRNLVLPITNLLQEKITLLVDLIEHVAQHGSVNVLLSGNEKFIKANDSLILVPLFAFILKSLQHDIKAIQFLYHFGFSSLARFVFVVKL